MLQQLGPQRRVVLERGMRKSRAQIGIAAERCTNGQQACLWTLVGRQCIELVIADRAEKDRIALERGFTRGIRQRRAVCVDGRASDRRLREREAMLAMRGDGA